MLCTHDLSDEEAPSPAQGKTTPSTSVSTGRASIISIITKSSLFSKGPSRRSRVLLFLFTILLVTITCLVFLLGDRIIRGNENHGQLEKMLEKMFKLDTLTTGHSNMSDTYVVHNISRY